MKLFAGLLIVLVAIIAYSCNEETEIQNVGERELLPLKIGNRWNYETVSATNEISYHYNEVRGDTVLVPIQNPNERWYILGYDEEINSYCINKSDGLWFLSESGIPILYYKNPAVDSDDYITSDSTHIRIVSNNKIITVKGGSFSCIHYDTYNKYYAFDEYWAPGVGLVHLTKYQLNTKKQIVVERTELISYTLK